MIRPIPNSRAGHNPGPLGLERIVQACGGSKEAFQMLMLEHLDTLAEASSKAISNIKFDKVVVWENGGKDGGRSGTADFLSGLARTMPPMMQVMKDIGGIELPEALIRFAGDTPPTVSNNGGPSAAGPTPESTPDRGTT